MRVDIVSPPFAGHLFPLLDLAQYVQDRRIAQVRILSTEDASKAVEASRLSLYPLLPGKANKIREIVDTAHRVGSNPFRLFRQLKMNVSLMSEIRQQLLDLWQDDPPTLVLADFVVPIAGVVAQQLRIPWWTSMPTPCVLETGSGTPAYLGGWMPRSGFPGHVRDYLGWKLIRSFKRCAAFLVRKEIQELGFTRLYRQDGSEAIYSPERILAWGAEQFEFPQNWPKHLVFLGPVTGCPSFPFHEPKFVPRKKHVLITLGTHLWWAKDQISATLQAVAEAMPECVFHFTKGLPADIDPKISGNLHEYGYIPYDTYINRYDAAIIHGGPGVLYSCLKAAVPMLASPQDYDQFDYAARIVFHRLGLRWRPLAKDIVTDLKRLLSDITIHENLERFAGILKTYNPHDSFAKMLSTLKEKNGLDQ